jgi:gluconate 2-dehydrogenase gamma chain
MNMLHRRELLAGVAWLAVTGISAHAGIISGKLPWSPNSGNPPNPARLGPWLYFTSQEGAAIEALADRIIPSDPQTPGGKDAGCAVYLDRQMAGPYGHNEGHYNRPPYMPGAKNFGPQTKQGPAQKYRDGLAALDKYCRASFSGKPFAELDDAEKDKVLKGLEGGEVKLEGADGKPYDGKAFFEQLVKHVQEGFFADPIYGGNRDMVAWKMIGFPGARYNYLDWIDRHNQPFPLPPVSMTGRAEWTPKS